MVRTVPVCSTLLLAICFTFSMNAATARVLIPVSTSLTPGGYGSQWTTEVWANNLNASEVIIVPLALSDFILQGAEIVRLPIFRPPEGAPPGQFLIMPKEQAPLVRIKIRARNLATGSETFGTEIPAVQEDEFAAYQALINVPADHEGARGLLRVYSLPGDAPSTIVLVVRARTANGSTLAERQIVINEPESAYLPGYAQLTLDELLGDEQPDDTAVTVEVEGEPDDRIWCFLSIVSNTSQHITTITP